MLTITFFPHATTFDNEAGISTGNIEVAVSPLGKLQIRNLHQATKDREFDAVFASDLSRAMETAEGAFGDRYEIIIDERLREINIGELTGKKDNDTEPLAIQYINRPFPGGESYKDIERKVKSFLNDASKKYAGKHIAVVGHQGTQLALDVLLKGLTWPEAFDKDWRKTKAFQYGWKYELKDSTITDKNNELE